MKTKIILLCVYLIFLVVALFQWRESGALLAVQVKAISSYGQLSGNSEGTPDKITFGNLAAAAQGEARVAYYSAERSRIFILLSLALTLPLSVHLASSFNSKKEA